MSVQQMKNEEYSVVIALSTAGEVMMLDYLNADSYTKEVMNTNRIPTAFDILHRSQKVNCSLMDPKSAHIQAFLYYFRRLEIGTAFHHAMEGKLEILELLQFCSDLQNEHTKTVVKEFSEKECRVLTSEVLGRTVTTMKDVMVCLCKQNSSNPASINSDSEEVLKNVNEVYRWLLKVLRGGEYHSGYDRVVDVALLYLLLRECDGTASRVEERGNGDEVDRNKELQEGEEVLIEYLSKPTACEEEDIREILLRRSMRIALSQFYVTSHQPSKALSIWREMGESGMGRSIDYLMKARPDENKDEKEVLELMVEFTPWMFAINPKRVFLIFTQAFTSTASIYQSVLNILSSTRNEDEKDDGLNPYRIQYIDHCVNVLGIHDVELATEYACYLIEEECRLARMNEVDLGICTMMKDTPACIQSHREKVLDYLKSNGDYESEKAWLLIENGNHDHDLWLEKVALLNRMKRYDEALTIILNELRSIGMACECCEEGGDDCWRILLNKLFYEEDEE